MNIAMARPPTGRTPRLNNLDLLRLFLAFEVVIFHVWGAAKIDNPPIPIAPVAAFITLSGLLIPESAFKSRSSWHFLWKRLLRTIPALIPLLLIVGIVNGRHAVSDSLLQYVSFGYLGIAHGVRVLWSLGVEDALYLVLISLVAFKLYPKPWVLWTALVTCILVARFSPHEQITYRFVDTTMGFIIGNLLYSYRDSINRIAWLWPVGLWLVSAVLFPAPLRHLVELPISLVCAVLIALRLPQAPIKIPDFSYGIYIWHTPIMYWLIAQPKIGRELILFPATVAASVVVAALSWYFVEKPALRFKDWQWKPTAATTVSDQSVALVEIQTTGVEAESAPATN